MPTYRVCCVAAIEVHATVYADSQEEAEALDHEVSIVTLADETVGAEIDSSHGDIIEVVGHDIREVVSVEEGEE